jgi:Prolipoprotein diacylglyceryl transferase
MGAATPGILVAQAVGRVGNYFNQELFGGPTTVPWALRIDPGHRPDGYERYATFHPTFLYELIFDLALAGALVWLGRRREIRAPGLFALYVAGYSGFRIFEEQLRIDPRTTSSHRVEPSAGVVRRLRRARHRPALGRHPRPGRGAARHRGDPAPDGRTVCLADCADRLRRGLRRIPGDHQHADDQVVMESAPVARPIASSAYSFLRFCGGAIAPFSRASSPSTSPSARRSTSARR